MIKPGVNAESAGALDIGECVLDSDVDIALDEAAALLDPRECLRAASFAFESDRDAFVRSHGFLRRRLGAFLNVAPAEIRIVVQPGKKPFVDGRPVEFSMSHSGSRAVVALARGCEIGIDLEVHDQSIALDDHFEGLVEMVLGREEQDAILATSADRRVRRFLSYWTAKEARMKLTGEGLSLDPQAISLDLIDGVPVGYRRPVWPAADLEFIALSRPDAVCCLATGRAG